MSPSRTDIGSNYDPSDILREESEMLLNILHKRAIQIGRSLYIRFRYQFLTNLYNAKNSLRTTDGPLRFGDVGFTEYGRQVLRDHEGPVQFLGLAILYKRPIIDYVPYAYPLYRMQHSTGNEGPVDVMMVPGDFGLIPTIPVPKEGRGDKISVVNNLIHHRGSENKDIFTVVHEAPNYPWFPKSWLSPYREDYSNQPEAIAGGQNHAILPFVRYYGGNQFDDDVFGKLITPYGLNKQSLGFLKGEDSVALLEGMGAYYGEAFKNAFPDG